MTWLTGGALTNAVLVNLNGSVVHLSHGLHLEVIAVAVIGTLAIDVLLEILRHKLREVLSVLQLIERRSVCTLYWTATCTYMYMYMYIHVHVHVHVDYMIVL